MHLCWFLCTIGDIKVWVYSDNNIKLIKNICIYTFIYFNDIMCVSEVKNNIKLT
jgi:hypothetical protein